MLQPYAIATRAKLLQLLLLCRFLAGTECHGFLLPALLVCRHRRRLVCDKNPCCSDRLGNEGNHTRACNAPYIYAHTAQRRPWKTEYPFNVVWNPTRGYPEHRRLGEPKL